jgi:hypothetical protein
VLKGDCATLSTVQVDGSQPGLQAHIEVAKVPGFPYFEIYWQGRVYERFSCNLSTIRRLRRALIDARLDYMHSCDSGHCAELAMPDGMPTNAQHPPFDAGT